MRGSELEHALAAFDLEGWLKSLGFQPRGHDEWTITCPRCGKPDKLSVNLRRKRWHCWVCARTELRQGPAGVRYVTVDGGGGVVALIAWIYGCARRDAAQWLLQQVVPEPALARIADLDRQLTHLEHSEALVPPDPPEGLSELDDVGLRYLAGRGIDPTVARAYRLLSCRGGRYHGRVIFPAWGPRGELLYWQARATWPASHDEAQGRRHIKAQNPPRQEGRLTSEHTLFNLHRAVQVGGGRVALCEGPISAIKAGDDAVALWGKRLSTSQLGELVRAGVREVELMLDGPTETEPHGAWPEMFALAPWLSGFFERVWLVRVPAGDPGDYDRAACAAMRGARLKASSVSGVQVI